MTSTKRSSLNLEYLNARKLVIPAVENINLVLIGCGGTGSWLAPTVARYARLLTENFDRDVKVTFVDPDRIEPKNVYRQNFAEAEIGLYKAETLAFRYGLAWGVSIIAMNTAFTWDMGLPETQYANMLSVYIGCVDNTQARRTIHARVLQNKHRETRWWLDAGNKKTVGQVLIGRGLYSDEKPLVFDGLCTWSPLPSIQHPELVDELDVPEERIANDKANLSCAELAMRGSQSLSINCRMAAAAGEMLGKFLLTNDLEYYASYIDQAAGETRRFITNKAIKGYLSKRGKDEPQAETARVARDAHENWDEDEE
jgi:PRTRC genetic system ThiF family protein